MQKFIGYVIVFVLGFGTCAWILERAGAIEFSGRSVVSARQKDDLLRSLERPSGKTPESALADPEEARAGSSAVAQAAAKVEPAVVNIDIEGRRSVRGERPLGMMFGGGPQAFRGAGSGIILSGDGYVVTNNHVIEPVAERGSSGQIVITLDNGKQFSNVEVVGRDPQSDLAVLKIQGAKDLPAATLGDSERIRVGDWAIAVGNPLGFKSTVTLGIISAVNRRDFRVENDALDKVIQTDAAINPGNSGGALANLNGEVIGINTAIASSTGASVGIGFAIPINAANRIIKQLIEKGRVVRPFLGITYAPLAVIDREMIAERFPGVRFPDDNQGALIVNTQGGPAVVPGSPADKAGLRPFDVIREIDGRKVDSVDVVKDQVQKHQVGDRIPLTIWREGRTFQTTVTLGEMPAAPSISGLSDPLTDPQEPPALRQRIPRGALPFGAPGF